MRRKSPAPKPSCALTRQSSNGDVAERTRQLHISPITTHLRSFHRRQLSARLGGALSRATATGQRLGLLFRGRGQTSSPSMTTLAITSATACCRESQSGFVRDQGSRAPARLGGDEFTILVEDVKSVRRLRRTPQRSSRRSTATDRGRSSASHSASVGASLYPDHAEDAEQLLRAADVPCSAPRSWAEIVTPCTNRVVRRRGATFPVGAVTASRSENGDLMLMFQPQIALHTFEVTGLEALLRCASLTAVLLPPPSSFTSRK